MQLQRGQHQPVEDDSNSDKENTTRCHNTTLNNEGDHKQSAVLDAIVNTESNAKAPCLRRTTKWNVAAAPPTSKEGKCEQSTTLKNWTSDPHPYQMPRDQKESELKDIGIMWKAYYGSESAGERTNETKVQFQSDENLCR